MQIARTVVWIVITAILVSFIAMNWERAPVNFWPLEDSYLRFEWPVGVIALLFFLLGLVPMWLLHRAGRWRLNRRISALENSVRATAAAAPVASAVLPEADTEPDTQPETATEKTEDTAS
ncbi:MAG: LapA family protein [Novosphingobium sp.]|nr:LapA family protein [Novosphingobium sp.]MCP5403085.1 LapA family protein [Novosphingobium sp.]